MRVDENNYDVIIAGAGPAGTTAATLLAQYGHRVLLIERGQHPRFHVGESMLPKSDSVMKRLGIAWEKGNLKKGGADFIDEATGRSTFFPLKGKYRTFQVERSVFDKRLFDNAVQHGVEAHQLEKVTLVKCRADSVQIETDKAQYQGRYFIDATGRDTLMGRQHKSIDKITHLGKFALYKHYKLAHSIASEALFATGNAKVLLCDIGWIWCFPITEGRVSIGLVVQKETPRKLKQEALFDHYIQGSPYISELLAGSEDLLGLITEADFSYQNTQRYGQRFACCGDAAGFLDPVFSSGFYFALKTAERIADQLHKGLVEGIEAEPDLQQSGDEFFQSGFKTVYLMIERFYCSNLVQNLFFEADREQKIKQDIVAILAGDLWSEGNRFQQGLLRGRNVKSK
ncbi:MAG: FAD-dependent oxidoreductase [Methyloprofundus sp.]|nr:FAD-dependent oxidoreductase [Methyloprofundus sp.]